MRKFALLCLLAAMVMGNGIAQNRLPAEKPLPIMAWAGLPPAETNLSRFLELKEMGINVSLSNYSTTGEMIKALDLAEKAGLKMITSSPELKAEVVQTTAKVKNHPALLGYFLRDEPVVADMPALGEWGSKILQSDPHHYLFVNLIASIHPHKAEALGAATYAEYLRKFIQLIPAQMLSFDFYPILTEGIHERWYEGLEIFSAEARKAGKPFWAFALASSYNELHPVPTMAALRLQLYSNLAYGAQGLEYWAYRMSDGLRSAPLDLNGKRTVVYDRIKAVNKEIQDISAVFVGSRVVAVNHTGTIIPRGTTMLSKLPKAIRVFETEGKGALVAQLEKGDNSYFVIINRDLEKSMPYVISGDATLQKVLKDGTIVPAVTYAASSEIEPGDIAIFTFPTQK